MASEKAGRHETRAEPAGRIMVEDASGRRPFMRGIMIHSLVARGVPFEDAYRTANRVREQLRGRSVVSKADLAGSVRSLLGEVPLHEESRGLSFQITVKGEGRGLPFSKGLLSQSLLAAALDPNDAFDVARAIERELIARGDPEVDRHDLRQLAYVTLAREIGSDSAERYLVWRSYQHPGRPVILLLGGAAGVGKTSLALEVAHRLGIGRMLSTDSIRQIMRVMLSQDLLPALHGSSYDAYKMLPAESLGDDPVIEGFRAQAVTVSVGVRASMDRAVAESANLVLDGVSIVPGLIDLEAYTELANVIFLVVAMLDEESFRTRFTARASGQHHRPPHRYLENFGAIRRIHEHFLELADRHDVPIVDNASFDHSVQFIIRHVTDTLRKREDFRAAELP